MMQNKRLAAALACAVLCSWCWPGAVRGEGQGIVLPKTVYGTNDLKQYYEATGSAAAALFDAEVALISKVYLQSSGGSFEITGAPTLGQYIYYRYGYRLCPDERYADEPVPGFCSGFMVGPDMIATAGHCVSSLSDCRSTSFVFGYRVPDSSGPVTSVLAGDVYSCAEIVARVENATEDWALLRTDRLIVGHTPLPLRREGAVASYAPLAVVGHPMGLPAKFADNATATDISPLNYFQANLDVYAGNSGSAVVSLNALGELDVVEGVLVRGNADWRLANIPQYGLCVASVWCGNNGCTGASGSGWEEATRSTLFSPFVYGVICGDGLCEAGESCSICPDDCGPCPTCLERKQPCLSGSDCCSGRCRSGRCR